MFLLLFSVHSLGSRDVISWQKSNTHETSWLIVSRWCHDKFIYKVPWLSSYKTFFSTIKQIYPLLLTRTYYASALVRENSKMAQSQAQITEIRDEKNDWFQVWMREKTCEFCAQIFTLFNKNTNIHCLSLSGFVWLFPQEGNNCSYFFKQFKRSRFKDHKIKSTYAKNKRVPRFIHWDNT